jgi:Icc-related predicted phosphoesterase
MKYLRNLAWLVLVTAASLALVFLASPSHYEIAGIKTRVSVSARSSGGSIIAIPPLGEIRAATHKLPVGLDISIEGVNQAVLTKTLNDSKTSAAYFRVVERDARAAAQGFSYKLLFLAVIGGLIGCLLLTRRRLPVFGSVLLSLMITGGLLIGIFNQFDPTAFSQPRVTGPLASIPFLATSIENQKNPLDTLREDITIAAKNLKDFSGKIEAWEPVRLNKGEIRVLAVADLHSNPTGFSLLKRVSRDFDVDFIIDTGDITDFGTPLEASQLSTLRSINVPYLYIPGNHDTSTIITELSAVPPVKVLDGRLVQEKGLTIYGAGDPVAKTARVEPLNDKEMKARAAALKKDFAALTPEPDILAVHDPRLAASLMRIVPVIFTGHTHEAAIEEKDGTVIINPGSTGASGLRFLEDTKESDQIYTLSIVYINSKTKRVTAIDSIQVTGLSGEFSLTRQLFKQPTITKT